MDLSKRLQAVADLISLDMSVADVGTDHGYIPIYLIKTGKSPKAIAMDINEGPLLRAKAHIESYHLYIETRLSDGVHALQPGEVDCVVIAGMGGALTIKILEEGKTVFRALKEFVLQPQSELWKVREYLMNHGYQIIQEVMILEDGKFYPMMKVINRDSEEYNNVELHYGPLLLKQKHPILKLFLEKEMNTKNGILHNLKQESGTNIRLREKEIKQELEAISYALQRYY